MTNWTSAAARFSSLSKSHTYSESLFKKICTAAGGARPADGWAAIIQDGHGVSTDPICMKKSIVIRSVGDFLNLHRWHVRIGLHRGL
ncbi:MAG TPA: hypothetical protein VGO47_01920, partial [Chlamydiales bacterium]|nr:hypothetical protein [Chlamydiales bacterium]